MATNKPPKNPVNFAGPEQVYNAQLRQVARYIGQIVKGFGPPNETTLPPMLEMLRRYSDMLNPWAATVATRMITEVNVREISAWKQRGATISRSLRQEILYAPTGEAMRGLLNRQVELIKSLPIKAGRRVQELAVTSLERGTRYADFVQEVFDTGAVTMSRATLIARTETSRAAAVLTQTRAEYIGSTGYVWETSRDGAVRESHEKMQGTTVLFSAPPTLDNLTGHAGCLPNCRCWMHIILSR